MKGLALTATFLVLMAAVATAKPTPVKKMNASEDLNAPLTRNDVDINSGPLARCLSGSISRRPRPLQRAACPAGCNRPSSTKCTWPNCVTSASIRSTCWELK